MTRKKRPPGIIPNSWNQYSGIHYKQSCPRPGMNPINKKSKRPTKKKSLWLKQLGAQIKHFRQEVGMSQADLAYSFQMDAQNISRIERGLVSPPANGIKQISDALEIPIHQFYASLMKT